MFDFDQKTPSGRRRDGLPLDPALPGSRIAPGSRDANTPSGMQTPHGQLRTSRAGRLA